jgi:hypothetical protein
VEDLLVVDVAEGGEVVVEEAADQFVDGLRRHVARDHAEEALEHVAQRLDQRGRVVADQLRQFEGVHRRHDQLRVELHLRDDVGDQRDHRPQHLGVVDALEDAQRDGHDPLDGVLQVDGRRPLQDDLVEALAAPHQHLHLLLARGLALDEVEQHAREFAELLVGEGLHPAGDDAGELQLEGAGGVDELQDLEDGDLLEVGDVVLLAGGRQQGEHAEEVAERAGVDVRPAV